AMAAYKQRLSEYVYRSSLLMQPIFSRAQVNPLRLVYADGEAQRVLQAARRVFEEGFAKLILIGRREVVERRIKRLDLSIEAGRDFELVDPEDDPRYHKYWSEYHKLMERKGISPDLAKTVLRTNSSVIGSLMVHFNEADCALCGPTGRYGTTLES